MKKANKIISATLVAVTATALFSFSNSNAEKFTVANSNKSGKELFASSGCVACHKTETKSVGPSIKTIANSYKGNKKGLVSFFKGTGKVIVDPAMAAVMTPQVEVTKKMSSTDQSALADYMLSIK